MFNDIYVTWPSSEITARPARVARCRPEGNNVNTLCVIEPETFVFWSSRRLLRPAAGRTLHAASIAGRNRVFDPSIEKCVKWEHAAVAENGLVEFEFDSGRTYAFFLTARPLSQEELLNHHLPWPVYVYTPEDNPRELRILFPSQVVEEDAHSDQVAQHFRPGETLSSVLAFEEGEHARVVTDAPSFQLNLNTQQMVNSWALNGLIDGGVLIADRDRPIAEWRILTPNALSNPASPYGDVNVLAGYNWYYILAPSFTSNNLPWTAELLKAQLMIGEAAAVSIADLILLGDYYATFDELSNRNRRPAVNVVKGVKEDKFLAGMAVDMVMLSNFWAPIEVQGESNINWKKVKALVSALYDVAGPTQFSEIQTIVALRRLGEEGTKLELADKLFPWVSTLKVRQTLSEALTKEEVRAIFSKKSQSDQVFAICLTNGQFADLALNNWDHFSPRNWARFEKEHRKALEAIDSHIRTGKPKAPIPASAIARTAFGLHFLSDAFASGHMRTPREELGLEGALAAKVMHDIDNQHGLSVRNGFGHKWRAFGDRYFEGPREPDQMEFMKRFEKAPAGFDVSGTRNHDLILSAAGAALKQLHRQAQQHYRGDPNYDWMDERPNPDPIQRVLALNRSFSGLRHEDLAPGEAGASRKLDDILNATIQEKILFMRNYRPILVDEGPSIAQNHPPLYFPGKSVNVSSGAYHILKRWGGVTYQLCLRWHGQTVLSDFTKLYYLAMFTTGAAGEQWAEKDETGLFSLVQSLPQVTM